MWLVLTLVVGAAPFDDVLTGPPAVQPRLPASPRVSAPDDDFTERWLLETELFGTTLKPNPADTSEPAGLWCTHQEKGAWLFLRDPRTCTEAKGCSFQCLQATSSPFVST